MRHRKNNVKLDRNKTQRQALLRTQIFSLVKNNRISTTDAKAKYLRSKIEKLITIAKKDTLTSRRQVYQAVGNKKIGDLVIKIAQKYKEKKGGYTRLTKIGYRKGDCALITQIELL